MKRTHHCAQLVKADLGKTVSLSGWVDSIRDHGGIIFIDLRDRKGVTQVMFDPKDSPEVSERAARLKPESVVSVAGKVVPRPEGTVNASLPTGEVEVEATVLEVLNVSETPPFPLDDAGGDKVNEDLRLTYRYLDLRRPKMRQNLEVRHRADEGDPRLLRRAGLHRGRDACALQEHARGGPRVPRAVPDTPGPVLCPFPVAPAVQADPHGRPAWSGISRSRAASATRTCARTARWSSRQVDIEASFVESRGYLRAGRGHAEGGLEGRSRHRNTDPVSQRASLWMR